MKAGVDFFVIRISTFAQITNLVKTVELVLTLVKALTHVLVLLDLLEPIVKRRFLIVSTNHAFMVVLVTSFH